MTPAPQQRRSMTVALMGDRPSIRKRVVVGVGLVCLLSACSPVGGRQSPTKTGGQTPSATQVGARAALSGFECKADDKGRWSAKGTLNNVDGSEAAFVVRISVARKNSSVVASVTKDVTVKPSAEVRLDVPDFGKATGKGLECSAHVTRAVS